MLQDLPGLNELKDFSPACVFVYWPGDSPQHQIKLCRKQSLKHFFAFNEKKEEKKMTASGDFGNSSGIELAFLYMIQCVVPVQRQV